MSIDRNLLYIIGQRLPAIYDVIPRGPLARLSAVALNPQPLPPLPAHELGAAVASEFIHMAWFADRFGLNQEVTTMELDDWCPTRPKWPKFPPSWPRLPFPEPEPRPEWLIDFHLGFAARIAVASVEFNDTALSEFFDKAIARSEEAINSFSNA